jgi:hypothetical protein
MVSQTLRAAVASTPLLPAAEAVLSTPAPSKAVGLLRHRIAMALLSAVTVAMTASLQQHLHLHRRLLPLVEVPLW